MLRETFSPQIFYLKSTQLGFIFKEKHTYISTHCLIYLRFFKQYAFDTYHLAFVSDFDTR